MKATTNLATGMLAVLLAAWPASTPAAAQQGEAPPAPATEPVEVNVLVEQVTGDSRGWLWSLQEVSAGGINVDPADYVARLEGTLAETLASESKDVRRPTVLIRLARLAPAAQARPVLARWVNRAGLPANVRYEVARSLASLTEERGAILELLSAESDAVVAGTIDAIGNTGDDVLLARLAELLDDRERYQATRTGDALTRVQLLGEYKAFWAAHPDAGDRLSFLLGRAGEVFLTVPPPSPPVLSDLPVASWLLARFGEMFERDPGQLRAAVQAHLDTGPVNATQARLVLEILES